MGFLAASVGFSELVARWVFRAPPHGFSWLLVFCIISWCNKSAFALPLQQGSLSCTVLLRAVLTQTLVFLFGVLGFVACICKGKHPRQLSV
ncbi:hypothetical protein DFH06DRAFT_1249553, partial [Mycena polygramma]